VRRRRTAWRVAAAAIAASGALAAQACGVCVEDKIAAAYDHAVVERARERGEVVVFAQVRGRGTSADSVGAAREAAKRVRGVAARSVRASEPLEAVSFALDPRVRSPEAALSAVERAAGAAAVRLELLKVLR
jgi:hypothetical protein